MSRANLNQMLELSEDQLSRSERLTTAEEIVAVQTGDDRLAVNCVYSKGVTDGLKCALLILDGAKAEEAADYMIAALTMGPQEDT